MDPRDLLAFFMTQDGLATLHEVCRHFVEVETSDLLSAWDRLRSGKRIGILCKNGVPQLRGGLVLYSIARSAHPVYTVLMV